jgi:hypothetical protein
VDTEAGALEGLVACAVISGASDAARESLLSVAGLKGAVYAVVALVSAMRKGAGAKDAASQNLLNTCLQSRLELLLNALPFRPLWGAQLVEKAVAR